MKSYEEAGAVLEDINIFLRNTPTVSRSDLPILNAGMNPSTLQAPSGSGQHSSP